MISPVHPAAGKESGLQNCGSFRQKLRIGSHAEIFNTMRADDFFKMTCGSYGYGTFIDKDNSLVIFLLCEYLADVFTAAS